MELHDERYVLKVIEYAKKLEAERGRDGIEVYTKGNCGSLYKHLKSVFPQAKPVLVGTYGLSGHVITEIDGAKYHAVGKCFTHRHFMRIPEYENIEQSIDQMSFNYGPKSENWMTSVGHCFVVDTLEKLYMRETRNKIAEYVKTEEFLSLD